MKLALPILLLVVLGMVIAAAPPAENEPIAMEDRSPDTDELLSLPITNDEDDEGLAKETVEERRSTVGYRHCDLLCKRYLFSPTGQFCKCRGDCRNKAGKCRNACIKKILIENESLESLKIAFQKKSEMKVKNWAKLDECNISCLKKAYNGFSGTSF